MRDWYQEGRGKKIIEEVSKRGAEKKVIVKYNDVKEEVRWDEGEFVVAVIAEEMMRWRKRTRSKNKNKRRKYREEKEYQKEVQVRRIQELSYWKSQNITTRTGVKYKR